MDKETNSLAEQFKAKENELIRQYTLKIYPAGRSREVFQPADFAHGRGEGACVQVRIQQA